MLKLKIFILEDSESRIEYFSKKFDNHDVTICTEIIPNVYDILKNKEFDMLFLDHDIQPPTLNIVPNGNTIAKYMVENKLQTHAIVYVHSMNPIGANNIVKTLDKAGYEVQWIPFHLLKQCGGTEDA